MTDTPPRKLRYAMVGGGRDAFIGAVHRKAMALDGQIELVAGALSSSPEKARASGRDLGLADGRNHGDWQALLADELKRPEGERIDFVSIVTPNHVTPFDDDFVRFNRVDILSTDTREIIVEGRDVVVGDVIGADLQSAEAPSPIKVSHSSVV